MSAHALILLSKAKMKRGGIMVSSFELREYGKVSKNGTKIKYLLKM